MKLEGICRQWMGPRVDLGVAVRTALHRKGLARSNNGFTASSTPGNNQRSFSSSAIASAKGETVAVVGAGIAGLQSIRALRAKGFAVTAFDGNKGVGGLWREHCINYGVQVPKQLFEFTKLPFDEVDIGNFPTGAQVQRYIERYAKHFDLGDNIHTYYKSWAIQTKTTDGNEESHQFDKLVISTGL